MSAKTLKRWMEQNGKTAIDVASTLKLSPTTVRSFLKGGKVHRSTLSAFERLIQTTA